MNLTEIKERYDYDNPNGDFFYESINCAEAVQRAKDFRWLIKEVECLDFKMKQNAEFYQRAEKGRLEAEEEVEQLKRTANIVEPQASQSALDALNQQKRAEKAEAQEARLKETNRRLNRRCTDMEGALEEKLEKGKAEYRNFGRMLANAAAGMYKDQAAKAEAEAKRLKNHNYNLSKDNSLFQTEYALLSSEQAPIIAFINEVKISADRGCLRAKAEKLLEDLEGE